MRRCLGDGGDSYFVRQYEAVDPIYPTVPMSLRVQSNPLRAMLCIDLIQVCVDTRSYPLDRTASLSLQSFTAFLAPRGHSDISFRY